MCPKCREKLQIPDDREKIICMFCGEEIRVDEALGEKKEKRKISSEEREEALAAARNGLKEIIRGCDNPMANFKRDKYEGIFEEFYASNRSLFEAFDLLYSHTENPEEILQELADHLVENAKETINALKFKGHKNQKQMDLNFLVSVYLIPAILKYPATFTDPFTDCLVETWNKNFQVNIGKAGYSDIADGFRRKLCYITTAVCNCLGKAPDCYELTVLKDYRDQYLDQTPEGHELVESYYDIAPTIVKRIEKEPDKDRIYHQLYESYLMPCIHEIENQEYEKCQARYEEMVLELKEKYLH